MVYHNLCALVRQVQGEDKNTIDSMNSSMLCLSYSAIAKGKTNEIKLKYKKCNMS